MTGFDNLKHVTGEQTASEKFGLDDGDIQTLFYMREGGYKKRLLRTYSKSIQSFLKSPESKEAMSSQIDFNIWKSYYFN